MTVNAYKLTGILFNLTSPMTDIRIRIFGPLQKQKERLFYKVLGKPAFNEKILLCDYSEFDIPIDHTCSRVIDKEKQVNIDCKIILKSVSQGWLLPYEEIPCGHKTVSKFEFINGIPAVINELNALPDWFHAKRSFYFL